jgi:sRNA-binding protein
LATTKQAGDVMERPATVPTPGRKLLKGGAEITHAILKKSDPKNIRWLYGQVSHLAGVIWQLTEGGELFAWEDELMAHFEMKAAEAKAAAVAAAAAKTAEKEVLAEAARKSAQPAQPTLRRSRKTPARKAAASHQSQSEAVG